MVMRLFHEFRYRQKINSRVDGFNIACMESTDCRPHVITFAVLKAADNMTDGIHLADMAEEFVAKALALGCTAYQTCDIDKFDYRGCCLLRNQYISVSLARRFIGDGNHTHVGIDGAEGVIGCLCPCPVSVELNKCAFAHVGQTYDT